MLTVEFGKLTVKIEQSSQASELRFSGNVDEHFVHASIPPLDSNKSVILNLAEIRLFNSVGIREWVGFIRRLNENHHLIMRNCSVAVIDQFNLVPETLANAVVESFYAPYYCECGQEPTRLIDVSSHHQELSEQRAPEFKCECGQDLEFDAIEESYFQFFQGLPKAG